MKWMLTLLFCLAGFAKIHAQSPITLTNTGYTLVGTDTIRELGSLRSYRTFGRPDTNAQWDLGLALINPQAGL